MYTEQFGIFFSVSLSINWRIHISSDRAREKDNADVGGRGGGREKGMPTSASEENGQDLVDLEYWMDGWERKTEKRSSPKDRRKICILG